MPSYSVSLNAVVSPTGGSIARLDAVCAAGPATNMVVVANTANLAVAGGKFRGVALEAAAGNQAIQIVDFGTVDLLTTVLSGTGDYVSVNATGQLVRTATVTAATIGTLENGTVHVNVALGIAGATTSATAIQGVPVSTALATVSYILAGNGANLHGRRGILDFEDILIGGVAADQTGTIPCDAWLRQAWSLAQSGWTIMVKQPSAYYRIDGNYAHTDGGSGPLIFADNTAGGNKTGVTFLFEGGLGDIAGNSHFRVATVDKYGYTASVTARTNGGSGDMHQTWELGASSGVTVATKDRWIGRHLCRYGCATDGNNGDRGVIVDVPSDNTVRIYNPNDTAAGTDANNGAICWEIDEPVFVFAAKDTTVLGMSVAQISTSRIWCFAEVTSSTRAGGRPVTGVKLLGCTFSSDSSGSGTHKDCIGIARDTVGYAENTSATYYRGTNGLGEQQWYATEQASETLIFLCNFVSATDVRARSAVALWSTAAQSKNNKLILCKTVRQQFVACVPKDTKLGGAWGPSGLAHFDIEHHEAQQNFDAIAQAGGYASDTIRMVSVYSENAARLFKGLGNGVNTLLVAGCTLLSSLTTEHASGAWIETGARQVIVENSYIDNSNGNTAHITHVGTQTNRECNLVLRNFVLRGTSSYTTEFGIRQTTLRGPFDFGAGGQKLGWRVDGAAQVDVTFSQANFNAACGYTVNLRKVTAREVAITIQNYITGSKAWGDGDDAYVYVRSATNGGSGSIRAEAPMSGTSANTILGFGLAATSANRAATELAKSSGYMFDHGFSSGSGGKFHLIVKGVQIINSSTSAQSTVYDVDKHINSSGAGDYGGQIIEGIVGLSKTNGVQPKNFWTTVTISDANTSAVWTFGTGEDDTSYVVVPTMREASAAAAAGSLIPAAPTKATGSYTLNLRAAPGVGESVTYHLELRR